MGYTKRTKVTKRTKMTDKTVVFSPGGEKLFRIIDKILKKSHLLQEGETMNKSIVTSPVRNSSTEAKLVTKTQQDLEYKEQICFGDEGVEAEQPTPTACLEARSRTPQALQVIGEQSQEEEEKRDIVKFSDQIKIDFIPSIDYRILCRFLGVTTVNEIKNHPYQSHPLITLILMETLEKFMRSKNFNFVGELNFDQNGNSIPPEKNPWHVQGKETTFTTTGFLYFESKNGEKKDNISFFLYSDLERGGASITCYSTDTNRSKDFVNELQAYAKKNNCLRGAKLKDVNMISASFLEVEIDEKYTWDNYYYPESIKKLFELEVLGFIQNVDRYNKCGINKRGIILHGKPGCVLRGTKIRIRKKKKEGRHKMINE